MSDDGPGADASDAQWIAWLAKQKCVSVILDFALHTQRVFSSRLANVGRTYQHFYVVIRQQIRLLLAREKKMVTIKALKELKAYVLRW